MIRVLVWGVVALLPCLGHAQAKAGDSGYLTRSLPESGVASFKGFKGHDPAMLFGVIQKHVDKRPVKSEYETVAAFEGRTEKWRAARLAGGIGLGSTLAMVAPLAAIAAQNELTRTKYDAEQGTLTIQMMDGCGGAEAGVAWLVVLRKTGSYVGSNAFGVKKTITQKKLSQLCLRFPGQPDWLHFKEPFKMDAESAREMARVGYLAIFGPMFDPYADFESRMIEATISDPVEISVTTMSVLIVPREVVIFDPRSGRIFVHAIKSP